MRSPRDAGNEAPRGPSVARVAITGITGFLGTALAARLVAEGHAVRGLCRARSARGTRDWLLRLGVTLVDGELDPSRGLDELCRGQDLLLHGAAVIGYRRRMRGLMQRVNVIGTREVLAAAARAGVGRLVHVSSIAALGATSDARVRGEDDEADLALLDAPYFDTKAQAEDEVARAVAAGLDAVLVNPAAIYGPSDAVSNSSNVIATILRTGMPWTPPGGINLVPLATVVEGVLAAARGGRAGRRYLLVGENLSVADLVRRVGAAAGRELRPRELPALPWDLLRRLLDLAEPLVPERLWFTPDMLASFGRWMWFDGTRARQELGVATSSLDECLAATVAQLRRDGRVPR